MDGHSTLGSSDYDGRFRRRKHLTSAVTAPSPAAGDSASERTGGRNYYLSTIPEDSALSNKNNNNKWRPRKKPFRRRTWLTDRSNKVPIATSLLMLFGFFIGLLITQQRIMDHRAIITPSVVSVNNDTIYANQNFSAQRRVFTFAEDPPPLDDTIQDENTKAEDKNYTEVTRKKIIKDADVSIHRATSTPPYLDSNHPFVTKWKQEGSHYNFEIVFEAQYPSGKGRIVYQPPVVTGDIKLVPPTIRGAQQSEDDDVWDPWTPDLGGLDYNMIHRNDPTLDRIVKWESFAAVLNSEWENWEKAHEDDWIDSVGEDWSTYYALDDDYVRGRRVSVIGDPPGDEEPTTCRRVHEHRLSFPNCNAFHQLDYAGEQVSASNFEFVNHGSYREIFGLQYHYMSNCSEWVALKETSYQDIDGQYEDYEYVRIDATVAERLASHRRIFDIYGYCGLSILSEYFYHGDIQQWTVATKAELDMAAEILSPAQKIVLGLEMAQGLQLLHDHETARIVHGDVQMGQFLLNENMTMLKLNDFNRAEFQLWDATARDYCRHRNGRGGGTWRAPEEYRDDPLTEKVDVWSLGNNLYVLLTGTGLQFGRHRGMPKFQKIAMITRGRKAIIPSELAVKSEQERVMIELIDRCWAYKPEDRPTMADIVEALEAQVQHVERLTGTTRQEILQSLREQEDEDYEDAEEDAA